MGLVNSTKRRFRHTINNELALQTDQSALESVVLRYAKGCSAANRLLLRADREQWPQGEVPPSHRTYTRDGITQIDQESFMKAFKSVYKSELLPSIKWTSLQVLIRTLWTKVKESRDRGGDDRCVNCGLEAEHTTHMLFHCNLAMGALQKVTDSINSTLEDEINPSTDLVLFHHSQADLSRNEKEYITDILMIYKHVIYRLRFRENVGRFPTVKLVLINIILETEKLIRLKISNGSDTEMLSSVSLKLRQDINWNV